MARTDQPATRWLAGAALAPPALLVLGAVLVDGFDYNRWDNFEIHTAIVTTAHGMLLRGEFPHLNPHQHLGEPLHAAMQCGTFYLPYTLALLLTKLLGLPTAAFSAVSAALHAGAGSAGWTVLLGRFGVRPSLAAGVGVAAAVSGFALMWTPLWLFTAAFLALTPWLLLGAVALVDDPLAPRPTVGLAVLLAATLFVGYPTWSVYAWMLAAVAAAVYALLSRAPGRMLGPVPAFLFGGLLAGPFLVPALRFLASTPRAGALDPSEVLRRAAPPHVLLDVLLPVFHYANGFLGPRISIWLHVAGWVAPALLGAWMLRRTLGRDDPLRAALLLGLVLFAGCFVLALGRAGGVLPLTLWIPVWSSFRWPFKFLPFAAAGLVLAAGAGLEVLARAGGRGTARMSGALAGAVLVGLIAQVALAGDPRTTGVTFGTAWGVLAAATGLASMALAGGLHRPRVLAALLALVPAHALACVGLAQTWGARSYPVPWAAVGAESLGIDTEHRVLPLSRVPDAAPGVFEHQSAGHAATANGYLSATGTKTDGLMQSWYLDVFPTDHLGHVPAADARPLVASSLLRGLAVRWYVVGRTDPEMVAWIGGHPQLSLVQAGDASAVFEDPAALPRLWLAERLLPWDEATGDAPLRSSAVSPRTALVPDLDASIVPGPGAITESSWGAQGVDARLDVPDGGLVVAAMTWSPGWLATVDGVPTPVLRVNGLALGVTVPPGAQQISLRFRTPGLTPGLLAMALGLAGLVGFVRWRRRA